MTTIQLTPNRNREFLLRSSATQVKMFVHNNPNDAEKTISQWLQQNEVTIHHIAQSQSERGGSFVFVITVFYLTND
jgi:hypothetical protein